VFYYLVLVLLARARPNRLLVSVSGDGHIISKSAGPSIIWREPTLFNEIPDEAPPFDDDISAFLYFFSESSASSISLIVSSGIRAYIRNFEACSAALIIPAFRIF